LGEQILAIQDAPGDWFLHAQPQVKTLWRWHASEESEHKCIAHDLYQILGGSHSGRLRWFAYVTVLFTLDVTRQTLNNLWHDKTLFSWRTWRDGFEFFLGRHGLVWRCAGPVAQYLKRDFHPMRVGDSQLARDWLQQHQHQWSAVNQRHQVS
jgi:predicted metal-dependent hydrolase